jgi:hypothetical protein
MPRKTIEDGTARTKKIIAALDRAYPTARFEFTSAHFLLGCFHEWHRFHGG